jgi:glycine/D-amino acid oxidase-like deaminating enzyme
MGRPLWWDDPDVAAAFAAPREPLDGSVDADVAIVGGGYTGLWTALHLLRAEPAMRVVVVESDVCGFGASGRNGGWASAFFSDPSAHEMEHALETTVDDLGVLAAEEGIDCHYRKGGSIDFATTGPQERRLRDNDGWLSADEATKRVAIAGARGAKFTPHCARIQPARLAVGLAVAVERRDGRVVERTRATAIEPGVVRTGHGDVRAPLVVRATEGFTRDLPGLKRRLVPIHSLMIATEPLPAAVWDEVGWEERETLTDARNLIIYAQRTADDRIAFGGRGAPYRFGSRYSTTFPDDHPVFADLQQVLATMLPPVAGARITHRWGGPLGVPRDWYSSVGVDRSTGLAWGGGYVGDGVTTSLLAGQTLADLILERTTARTALPWVDHRSRSWEPEPLRWLGINAGLALTKSVDDAETKTGRTPKLRSKLLEAVLGR